MKFEELNWSLAFILMHSISQTWVCKRQAAAPALSVCILLPKRPFELPGVPPNEWLRTVSFSDRVFLWESKIQDELRKQDFCKKRKLFDEKLGILKTNQITLFPGVLRKRGLESIYFYGFSEHCSWQQKGMSNATQLNSPKTLIPKRTQNKNVGNVHCSWAHLFFW